MKKAVLVVSFGTSYHETRKKTIEVCERKISEKLEGYDFYRAFTSNMIINPLNINQLHLLILLLILLDFCIQLSYVAPLLFISLIFIILPYVLYIN